jgi:hypothetical protein
MLSTKLKRAYGKTVNMPPSSHRKKKWKSYIRKRNRSYPGFSRKSWDFKKQVNTPALDSLELGNVN